MTRRRLMTWTLPAFVGLAVVIAMWFLLGLKDEAVTRLGEEDRPIVGMISNNPNGIRNVMGFRDGLRELGFIDGETVTLIFAGEPTAPQRLEAAIQEMIEQGADLIFTTGTPTGVAAFNAQHGTPPFLSCLVS